MDIEKVKEAIRIFASYKELIEKGLYGTGATYFEDKDVIERINTLLDLASKVIENGVGLSEEELVKIINEKVGWRLAYFLDPLPLKNVIYELAKAIHEAQKEKI